MYRRLGSVIPRQSKHRNLTFVNPDEIAPHLRAALLVENHPDAFGSGDRDLRRTTTPSSSDESLIYPRNACTRATIARTTLKQEVWTFFYDKARRAGTNQPACSSYSCSAVSRSHIIEHKRPSVRSPCVQPSRKQKKQKTAGITPRVSALLRGALVSRLGSRTRLIQSVT